jgi:hypothetical protein
MGTPEGKGALIRPRREDSNIMDLREKGWGGMDWIHQNQGRGQWWALVNAVMNLWVK